MTEVLVRIAGLVIRIRIGILVRKAIATSQVRAEARAQKVVPRRSGRGEDRDDNRSWTATSRSPPYARRRGGYPGAPREIQRQERRVGDKEESLDGKLSDLERRSENGRS